MPDNAQSTPQWDDGFEGTELRQQRERATWPMARKVEWLEAAQETAEALRLAGEVARRKQQEQDGHNDS